MLYRGIIAVCSQIHIKNINTLCGQNVELLNVQPGGTYIYIYRCASGHSHSQPYSGSRQHHLSIATALHRPSPTCTFQPDTHNSSVAHNRRPTDRWHVSTVHIHSPSQFLTIQKCLLFPFASLPRDTAQQVKATPCHSFNCKCKADT